MTYPAATPPGQPMPLVAYVHGGPMARDSWGYDPHVQFLAQRGYAVLQVNYRGSSGYGAEYQQKGLFSRLDTVVLDDVADGVKFIVADGKVDPQRIAVMGASFGGWATYLSLVKYPDLYRCGVAIAAVAHWKNIIADSKRGFHDLYGAAFWEELLRRQEFPASERFIDPLVRAAELKQPILIMHGERDTVVDPTETRDMIDALRKSNPHVESASFPTASHSDWPQNARIRLLNEADNFLRRNLTGSAPPPAVASGGR